MAETKRDAAATNPAVGIGAAADPTTTAAPSSSLALAIGASFDSIDSIGAAIDSPDWLPSPTPSALAAAAAAHPPDLDLKKSQSPGRGAGGLFAALRSNSSASSRKAAAAATTASVASPSSSPAHSAASSPALPHASLDPAAASPASKPATLDLASPTGSAALPPDTPVPTPPPRRRRTPSQASSGSADGTTSSLASALVPPPPVPVIPVAAPDAAAVVTTSKSMTNTTATAMDPALATENHTEEEPDRIGRKVSAADDVKRNDSKVRFGRNKASTPVPAETTGPEDDDDGTAYPSTAEFDHPAAGDVEEAPVPPDSTGTATLARTLNARSKNLRTLTGKKSAGSFTTLSRKTVSRTKSQSNLGAEGNGAEPAAVADGDQPAAKDDTAGAAPATLPRKPTWFGTMRGTVGRSSLSRSSSVTEDDDDASAPEEERQNRKKYAEAVRSLNWGMWKKGVEAMDALAADGGGVEKAVIFLDPAQSPFKNPTGCWYLGRLCEEKAEKLQQQPTEQATSAGGEGGPDGHATGAMTDALVHAPIDEDAPTPEERRRDLFAKALAWFAIGAHGGYPPAMISMAKMLSSGAGTDNGIPNIGLSIKWLYRAYKAPNQTPGAQSEAAEILGKLYMNGVSSPAQTDGADAVAAPSPGELDWAAMSDQEASLHTSVPQDLSLATQWLRRAARRSNTAASETLASLSEIEPHNARADAVDHIRHGRFRTGIQALWDLEAQGFPDAVRDLDSAVSTLPAATARRNVEGGHKPNAAVAGWIGVFLLGVAARERRASILVLTPPKLSDDDDGDDDEDARIAAAADPSNPAQRDDA
ncbi:hypothetical protein HK405_011418, partial [Cladochytrium tenue]